jgi:KTSC domain
MITWRFPRMVFEDFLAAESKGRFVNWQIKPYYRFMPVADGE